MARILTGVGSKNGVGADAFDRWFRYPAGFSQATLGRCISALTLSPESIVLDPFAGAGTTATAVARHGSTLVGLEVHPLIHEIAALKALRPGDPSDLRRQAAAVCQRAMTSRVGASGMPELVRRSFSATVLRDLLALRQAILASRSRWRTHLKWALLASLRDLAEVKVGWPYQRPGVPRQPFSRDPYGRFIARTAMMADDLSSEPHKPNTRIKLGDARRSDAWTGIVESETGTACCTSPPYLNNFDYADATRLELFFWGDAATWSDMCDLVRRDMVIATTQQTRAATAEAARLEIAGWGDTGQMILALTERLTAERKRRPRGKEYDAVLPLYMRDMNSVLGALRPVLKRGAPVAWVIGDSAPYGIYVDTPDLIRRVAERSQFEFHSDTLLRRRGLRWRTNGARHQVALAERLLLLRAPGRR